MTSFLRIEDLSKYFGKLAALRNVSLTIERGEVVGLIGPNGAGKTTLFNVMTGFYPCSNGRMIFKGKEVTRSSPNLLAKMGMVRTFQIPRPFKELKVFDNVAIATLFNPRIKGLKVKQFVEEILQGVQLHPWKEKKAALMGYGSLKRLELGRSQGMSPELLLLDEPFSGLNSAEIEAEGQILKNLIKEGLTLIIVEHKLRELMKLVNRVVVLNFGVKIADGTPERICQDKQVLEAYLGRKWNLHAT